MDFRFYVSRFVRRLHYFLLLAVLGAVAGISLATMLPPKYLAQARLLVESEQIPGNLAASTVQVAAREQLQIIQQRILTRATLLELANRLNLYRGRQGSDALDPDQIVEDLRERIRITLPDAQGRGSTGGAALVTVSFTAETGQMAATVANDIVTMILNENVQMRTGTSSQTLAFFEEEVRRLDQALAGAGAKILEFKTQNQKALPDGLEFRRTQMASRQERTVQLDRDLTRLRERRDRLVMVYETTGQIGPVTGAPQTPEQRQLASLQTELQNLLLVLSPSNPRIKMLEARIAQVEGQIAAQSSGVNPQAAGLSAYEVQLNDIDAEIQSIEDEKTRITEEMAGLQRAIDATPRNAIALEALERDYSNIQAQYNQAVSRRASAQTGDLIETLSKGGRISVIEQAVVPREPDSPNRPLIAAAGVGGGIAAGLGLVLLLELMNSAIHRPADITAKLGITPFATLPLIRTRRDLRRRRMILALAFGLVLIGIPLGLWAVQTYYMPLDLLLQKVLTRFNLAEAAPALSAIPVLPV